MTASAAGGSSVHMIVPPGGGHAEHAVHEAEPIADWLGQIGVPASVFRYPLHTRHPVPLEALRAEISRHRADGAQRIGVHRLLRRRPPGRPGCPDPRRHARPGRAVRSAGLRHHLDGNRDLPPSSADLAGRKRQPGTAPVDLAGRAGHTRLTTVLHLAYRREHPYVPPEHAYRLATALAAGGVPHAVHVFAHGPHSLGLARGADQTESGPHLRRPGSTNRCNHVSMPPPP